MSNSAASIAPPSRCPACDLPPRQGLLLANGSRLLQCPRCLMGWWNWNDFDAASFYDESYFQSAAAERGYDDYDSLEPGLRRTARTRLRALKRAADRASACLEGVHLGCHAEAKRLHGMWMTRSQSPSRPPVRHAVALPGHGGRPARLFDVGCGTGVFLDEARRSGLQVAGLEVSEYAAGRARARGLSVRTGPVDEFAGNCEYDFVTLWDVIEHLKQPARTLERLGASLRPGGVLALSTGDLDSLCARLSGRRWHLFNLPEHLFFFTPRALRTLLTRAGLRPVFVRRELTWFPAGYLMERLGKFGFIPRTTLPDRRPALRRLTIPMTLCDIVSVYAVKPAGD